MRPKLGRAQSILDPLYTEKYYEHILPNKKARHDRTLGVADEWAGGSLSVTSDKLLLYELRDDLDRNGPKFGYGLSQCGACSVLLDGIEIRTCVTRPQVR